MLWERKKGSLRIHPEDLGFGKLFEVIRDGVIVADAKTQRIVLWNSAAIRVEPSLSSTGPADESGGPYEMVIVRNLTKRNRAEEFTAQLLRGLSGKLISELYSTLLPDAVSQYGVPLQEPQEVRLTTYELEALRLLALGKLILRYVNTGGKR